MPRIDNARVKGLILAPSSVEELAYTPSAMEKLKKIEFVITGGGKSVIMLPISRSLMVKRSNKRRSRSENLGSDKGG